MNEKSFFGNKKKGKLVELKADLCSDKKERRKEALKKIINDMTTGNDMSELFPDVVKLLQADNSETKKLVYLYLMSYARSHPDLAILAVNTFVRDCDDTNPLIRALAVRTMCCLASNNLTAHLCDPLRKCLKDNDPYVRKTAVISVLKLWGSNEHAVKDQNFINILIELLMDSNPTVLTNSLAVLSEIFGKYPEMINLLTFDIRLVNKLLGTLNECTEWGQIIILDFLVFFRFNSQKEALNVAERITSRLSHANSAIVLSTIKLIINIINYINNDSVTITKLLNKLSPPLVTMLSLEPEIQYVVLRNINLIIQKYPTILSNDLQSFYVKYNDPLYIKIEKLDILIMLVDENNVDRVLTELKDYSSEIDVEFVRKAVRAIGDCALKIESAADKCVKTLLDLIDTKITYVVQESIIVTRDIMRKFPKKYENVIQKIGDNLFSLDEPNARAALIWIIGEFGERIENSRDFLKMFSGSFLEENSVVQLQLLTATVKLFLKKPEDNRDSVEEILSLATQKIENPDIRDRAFMYWRLLSNDPEVARRIILTNKPALEYKSRNLDQNLLDNLLPHISTLCSVFHKMPQSLVDSTMLLRSKSVDIPENNVDSIFGMENNVENDSVWGDNVGGISGGEAGGGAVVSGVNLLNFDNIDNNFNNNINNSGLIPQTNDLLDFNSFESASFNPAGYEPAPKISMKLEDKPKKSLNLIDISFNNSDIIGNSSNTSNNNIFNDFSSFNTNSMTPSNINSLNFQNLNSNVTSAVNYAKNSNTNSSFNSASNRGNSKNSISRLASNVKSQFEGLSISQEVSAKSSQLSTFQTDLFQSSADSPTNLFDSVNKEQNIFNPQKSLLLSAQSGKNLEIYGNFASINNKIYLNLSLNNSSSSVLSQFSLMFNLNYFGLAPEAFSFPSTLPQGKTENIQIPMGFSGSSSITLPVDMIHIAFKTNQDIFYFSAYFPLHYFFTEPDEAKIEFEAFNSMWNSLWPTNKLEKSVSGSYRSEYVISKLKELKMYIHPGRTPIVANCQLKNKYIGLIQITVQDTSLKVIVGSNNQEIIEPISKLIFLALSS